MSLYLKYRPRDFNSLVWQNFIKETLKEAINSNKTVWAYLFCGPRWTGKTSTARIMAKALNCTNLKDWNPCNDCEICNSINNESLIDVIEIDAASHTWVDNIRELIERAQFSPTHAKYKVYIIDEVHMLSKGAFNALLKTLEEPPSYVKFILATTETHKVPDTIISRCQRYDFSRISEEDIKSRLEYIAKQENIEIDQESLEYISQNSWGGLRNAISLFEQLISNNKIQFETIINTLWIVNKEKLNEFLNKLLNKDPSIISDIDELISQWKNLKLFFKELIFFIKEKTIEQLKDNKNIWEYINLLEILDDTYSKTKNSLDENLTFNIWILKILNWNQAQVKQTEKPKIQTQQTPQIPKKECVYTNIQEEENKQETKKESLDINDIWDIFWWNTKIKEEKQETPSNNSWSFNKEELIKKLKELWAKWALTMSIRWANCQINWDNFEIILPTSFALKSTNTDDNQIILKKALEELKLGDLNLIIKSK